MNKLLKVGGCLAALSLPWLWGMNLAGYSDSNWLGNDDGFVSIHEVKDCIPMLSEDSLNKLRVAIVAHQTGNFENAIILYAQAQFGTLTSGEKIDLFEELPRLIDVNVKLAREHKKSGLRE